MVLVSQNPTLRFLGWLEYLVSHFLTNLPKRVIWNILDKKKIQMKFNFHLFNTILPIKRNKVFISVGLTHAKPFFGVTPTAGYDPDSLHII